MSEKESKSIASLGIYPLRPSPKKVMVEVDMSEPRAPFTDEEYKDRLRRLRERMEKEKIDLLYVTAPDSMYYLHGYNKRYYRAHGSTASPPMGGTAVRVDHDNLIQFESAGGERDFRMSSVVNDLRFIPDEGSIEHRASWIMNELKAEGWLRGVLGMEFWSFVPNQMVSQAITNAFLNGGGKKVVDGTRPLREVRRVKSLQEIAYLEEAAHIADLSHQAVEKALCPGITELELCGEGERAMAKAGGEPPAIPNAIASGPNLTWNSWSSRRVIEAGDLVMWDAFGVYNRYHATVSRAYFVGEAPAELVKLFRLAGGGFNVLSKVAKAGTAVAEVCRTLRDYYEDVGIWKFCVWAAGIEQTIAFPPGWAREFFWDVSADSDGVFLENEVTNYYSLLSGLLIDTFVYEMDGARRLSKTPAELIVVD